MEMSFAQFADQTKKKIIRMLAVFQRFSQVFSCSEQQSEVKQSETENLRDSLRVQLRLTLGYFALSCDTISLCPFGWNSGTHQATTK
jgi:hypothetical protein